MATTNPAETAVVILAGGTGTRLRPLTAVFPKPLVPLGNKPVIEILLYRIAGFGFRNVVLGTGYLAELVMAVCGDGSRFGLNIRYSHEDEPLGTAGPLALIDGLTDPFLVMNGDLLTTLNLRSLLAYHAGQQADATLSIYKREVRIDFGVIENDGNGQFLGYHEKPTYHFEVSMGVNALSRSVLRFMTRGERLDMPDLILRVHQSGGCTRCYREDCYWLDIGRMDDYALAQEQFAQNERLFLEAPG